MGNESLLGLSPAHRRVPNPPAALPFRRSVADNGWRSLAHRHKFLLFTLGCLTFLCTVYLYFAVTLGTRDSCSGLGGTQRTLCELAAKAGKANAHKAHHRRLMGVEDSDPADRTGVKHNMKEFLALMSSLASRKDLQERAGHPASTPVRANVEQWNGNIEMYKAMLDSVDRTKPGKKADPKPPRASRLRGRNFE